MFGGFSLCWLWLLGGCLLLIKYAMKKQDAHFDFGWPMVLVGIITWASGISFLWQLMLYISLLGASAFRKGQISIGGMTIERLSIEDQDNFFWPTGKPMKWYEKLAVFFTRLSPRQGRLSRIWTTTTADLENHKKDQQ